MSKFISRFAASLILLSLSLPLAPAGVLARPRPASPNISSTAPGRALKPAQRRKRRRARGIITGRSYINVYGERVPSPRKSESVPQGATALCNDGTYSFSRHRRGTCSRHGGVACWL
jgi:hypothetical protein